MLNVLMEILVPVTLVIGGILGVLLTTYVQQIRKRFDELSDHESLYVGECPHLNAGGTAFRKQGMVANPNTGEIRPQSFPSQTLINAVS